MDESREQRGCNAGYWSRIRDTHLTEWYDLDAFRAGGCSLSSVEVDAVGDVTGKRLLHLQCNCGIDTLSWARRGAVVTGVDLSDRCIDSAQSLAGELEIDARFICCDVLSLDEVLPETFDIVFASYGVFCWIDDVPRWMRVAARHLVPGGLLFHIDGHPILWTCDDDDDAAVSYFHDPVPFASEPDDAPGMTVYEWQWTVADIVNAAIDAGLRIERLCEYPFITYDFGEPYISDEPGRWRMPGAPDKPLMLSVAARRRLVGE